MNGSLVLNMNWELTGMSLLPPLPEPCHICTVMNRPTYIYTAPTSHTHTRSYITHSLIHHTHTLAPTSHTHTRSYITHTHSLPHHTHTFAHTSHIQSLTHHIHTDIHTLSHITYTHVHTHSHISHTLAHTSHTLTHHTHSQCKFLI